MDADEEHKTDVTAPGTGRTRPKNSLACTHPLSQKRKSPHIKINVQTKKKLHKNRLVLLIFGRPIIIFILATVSKYTFKNVFWKWCVHMQMNSEMSDLHTFPLTPVAVFLPANTGIFHWQLGHCPDALFCIFEWPHVTAGYAGRPSGPVKRESDADAPRQPDDWRTSHDPMLRSTRTRAHARALMRSRLC